MSNTLSNIQSLRDAFHFIIYYMIFDIDYTRFRKILCLNYESNKYVSCRVPNSTIQLSISSIKQPLKQLIYQYIAHILCVEIKERTRTCINNIIFKRSRKHSNSYIMI